MKTSSLFPLAAVAALLATVVYAVHAQAPAVQHQPAGGPPRTYPAPTNLKVLPKGLTGEQIHELMHQWEADLGTQCGTCHAADPKKIGPNGRPQLNFPDDSKPDKAMARIMYTMTEDIKKNYVARVAEMDTMGSPAAPVTCGTCHRGHLDPEPYVAPPEHDHEGHDRPPAGATPPMQH